MFSSDRSAEGSLTLPWIEAAERGVRRPAAARRVPRRVRRLRAVLPNEQAGAAAESPVMTSLALGFLMIF